MAPVVSWFLNRSEYEHGRRRCDFPSSQPPRPKFGFQKSSWLRYGCIPIVRVFRLFLAVGPLSFGLTSQSGAAPETSPFEHIDEHADLSWPCTRSHTNVYMMVKTC